jgi:hypothetical protein
VSPQLHVGRTVVQELHLQQGDGLLAARHMQQAVVGEPAEYRRLDLAAVGQLEQLLEVVRRN